MTKKNEKYNQVFYIHVLWYYLIEVVIWYGVTIVKLGTTTSWLKKTNQVFELPVVAVAKNDIKSRKENDAPVYIILKMEKEPMLYHH